jgi:hypothetical protein
MFGAKSFLGSSNTGYLEILAQKPLRGGARIKKTCSSKAAKNVALVPDPPPFAALLRVASTARRLQSTSLRLFASSRRCRKAPHPTPPGHPAGCPPFRHTWAPRPPPAAPRPPGPPKRSASSALSALPCQPRPPSSLQLVIC